MKEKKKLLWLLVLTVILIASLYTDPLVINLSRQFPGFEQSDTYLSVWNAWHLKKTLSEGGNIFSLTSDYIFYPQKPSLVLHNYTITSGLISLPFQLIFSPLVSMNLVFFLHFILSGLGMYFLVVYFTGNRIAGFWSGITLAFCPYVIIQSCYFIHFSAIWFFPWFIYLFWKFLDRGKIKYSILAGMVLAFSLLEDQTYFFFLSMLAVLMVVFRLVGRKELPARMFLKNSFVGLAVFFTISSGYLWKLLIAAISSTSGFPVWPDPAIDYFSLRPDNFLRPSQLLSVYRMIPHLSTPIMHVTNVFAGYVPLFFASLALIGFRTFSPKEKRIILFWLLTGTIFFLIALGPLPFGRNQFLNKFSLYNILCSGLLRQMRIPVRFSLVALIAVYILAGFGVQIFSNLKRTKLLRSFTLGLFLVVLQVIEFLPMPYPLLPLDTPSAYSRLALKDKRAPVLVLPLGWQSSYRTLGGYYKETQFYQTVHEHPIFQGQIARIDQSFFDYYLEKPGFKFLMEAGKRAALPEEKEEVYALLRGYRIKDVVIHRGYFSEDLLEGLTRMFRGYPGELSLEYVD